MAKREIVLDTETTGFMTDDGHRMVEIGMVELIDGKPSGKEYHCYFNPGADGMKLLTQISKNGKSASDINGLTPAMLEDKPFFCEKAQEIRDFIGDSDIVITCWVMKDDAGKDYTLDIGMLDMELAQAGVTPIPAEQWVNIRPLSEQMFGHKDASMRYVLPRYGVDDLDRDDKGHSAIEDAQLLAEIYPSVLAEYEHWKTGKNPNPDFTPTLPAPTVAEVKARTPQASKANQGPKR